MGGESIAYPLEKNAIESETNIFSNYLYNIVFMYLYSKKRINFVLFTCT